MIGDALFVLMGVIVVYVIYILSSKMDGKKDLKDYSSADISFIAKRFFPAFILFTVIGVIWSVGSEKGYF